MEIRQEQIEALKRIDEQSKLEKSLLFDKRTAFLDDLLQENNLLDRIYIEVYKLVDELKLKYNMSIEDSDILDDIIHEINSNTLKTVTSLKNVLIIV